VAIWAAIALPETRKLNAAPGARQSYGADLFDLARSAKFWGYVGAAAFGSATFFAFLGGGPHVIITLMERGPARIRRLVRDRLDRLHGRQFRRLAAIDALRHRQDDLGGASASKPWRGAVGDPRHVRDGTGARSSCFGRN